MRVLFNRCSKAADLRNDWTQRPQYSLPLLGPSGYLSLYLLGSRFLSFFLVYSIRLSRTPESENLLLSHREWLASRTHGQRIWLRELGLVYCSSIILLVKRESHVKAWQVTRESHFWRESSRWQNNNYVLCTVFVRIKSACHIYSQVVCEGPKLSLWLPALKQRTWKE